MKWTKILLGKYIYFIKLFDIYICAYACEMALCLVYFIRFLSLSLSKNDHSFVSQFLSQISMLEIIWSFNRWNSWVIWQKFLPRVRWRLSRSNKYIIDVLSCSRFSSVNSRNSCLIFAYIYTRIAKWFLYVSLNMRILLSFFW